MDGMRKKMEGRGKMRAEIDRASGDSGRERTGGGGKEKR